jgi:transposase
MYFIQEMKEISTVDLSRETLRYQMYFYAERYGVTDAAKRLGTTRKTVQLWRDRYREDKEHGLQNKSRVGQNHPLKTPQKDVDAIIQERNKRGNPGARTIINNLHLDYSVKTVHKIIKRYCTINKHRTRYKKKKDMTAVKAQYKPMEKIQIDTKYYNDIPEQYVAYKNGIIPKFQITARDYRTGMTFMGFTNYKDTVSTAIFADYLIEYLKGLGYQPNEILFQSDNGIEFVDPLYHEPTVFETTVAKHGVGYVRIPPAAPTFNSDVETFHNTIENEFLNIEKFTSLVEFLIKAFIYLNYYNHLRRIRTRGNKSPVQLIAELGNNLPKMNLCFIPIFCDIYRKDFLAKSTGGYLKGLPLINQEAFKKNQSGQSGF